MPKKPLKFDSKTSLFGEKAAKTWVLLANYCDKSLLRNDLAFSLSNLMPSIAFTSCSHFVDLYLNGEYEGVYQIADQIEVGSSRVDIDDDNSNVDTGYLIELDAWATEEDSSFTVDSTLYGIKSPDPTKENFSIDNHNFILNYVSTAFHETDWDTLISLIDISSFVDMYLMGEITGQCDVGLSSFYLYKPTSGKLFEGPAWDFDISSGNCNYNSSADSCFLWAKESNCSFKKLATFSEFNDLVKTEINALISSINDTLNTEKELFESSYCNSFVRNFQRWNILETNVWPNSDEIVSIKTWSGQVDYLCNWINTKADYVHSYYNE